MSRRFLSAAIACGIAAFVHGCTIRDVVEVVVGSVEVQPASITILEGETQQLTAQVRDESGEELPNGDLTWSSDAPSVFSIDRVTGQGQAVGPGQATIWATQSGAQGSGTISVEAGPSIVVSDPSLFFLGRIGGSAPSPIAVSITNGGGGAVSGISASVEYPAGAPNGWLSLALSGTSAPATLTVSSLFGSLGEGVYHATLVLVSPDARNSPVLVPVEAVVVLDTPVIGLTRQALEFQMEVGGAPPGGQIVLITNQGGGVLSDLQAQPFYSGVGGWLSTTLTETTAPTELLVEPDPSGLTPGTYIAEVRITAPGALNTPLALDVTLTIDASPVSPAHSTADVPNGVAGSVTDVFVQARNGSGYPLSSGGATVVVTVSGANETGAILATDVGDGTYAASYTPTAAGADEVAITLDGSPLGGSPFSSLVAVGSVSPEHSTATVPAGTVGLPTNLVVQARDAYGNPLSSGGAEVFVTVSGTNEAEPTLATDVGDGTYTATYTPTTAGTDEVAITLDGSALGGSPFNSPVGGGRPSPEHSTATVPSGTVGLPTNVVVQARDEYGNPLGSGGSTVVMTVSGENELEPILATDEGDGTYTASYTPTMAGEDDVAITMGDAALGGSPFSSLVAEGSASPEHSTAKVPNGREGRRTTIWVQARDAYGNPLSEGGETVVVTVSGDNEAGPILATDMGDGTYRARYRPDDEGTDVVIITMNGTPISGSPFTSKVRD